MNNEYNDIINLGKCSEREIIELTNSIKANKDKTLLERIKTIGFDNYAFKLICKRKKEILVFLIEAVTGLNLNIDDYQIYDAELLSGIKLKSQICDIYVKTTNTSLKYGIDIESEQKTNLTQESLFDRAVLSASKIYADLHYEGDNYKSDKRSIVIYFCNDKYNRDTKLNKEPFTTTKLVDLDIKPQIIHDNITIYRINVKEAIAYGFKNRIKNDTILVEALKVLSSDNVEKFIDSKDEVIKAMAEEIKKINSNKEDHKSSVLEELAEIRHEMDLGNTYRDGRKEGEKAKEKELISKALSKGLSEKEVAALFDISIEEVKRVLAQ